MISTTTTRQNNVNASSREGTQRSANNNNNTTTTTKIMDDSFIKYSLSSDDYLDQLLPTLKNSLMSDSLDTFIEKLDSAAKDKQEEMEDLSFNSVDDLTSTVSNIHKVSKSSRELAGDLIQLNSELDKTGSIVIEEKKKALDYNKLYSKVNKTIFTLNSCLFMLDKINKVLVLIQSGDFYKALMNLESLTKTQVEEIEHFEFIKKIYKSIPTLKTIIRDETSHQLSKWLSTNILKNLNEIGESLYENMISLNEEWLQTIENDSMLITYKINSPVEKSLRPQSYITFNPLHTKRINIDLGPLYQCMLVYQAFKEEELLKDIYAKELLRRRDSLTSSLNENINPGNNYNNKNNNNNNNNKVIFRGNESLKLFIHQLVAFFICDREIANEVGPTLRTKENTNDLYNSITSKLIPILKTHIDQNSDSEKSLNELNDIIGIYIQILEDYEFDTESIYEVLIYLFSKYIDYLQWEFSLTYKEMSMKDEARNVVIENSESYKLFISKCFYIPRDEDDDDEQQEQQQQKQRQQINTTNFPQAYPFSAIYPASCLKLRAYFINMYSFIMRYYGHRPVTLLKMIGESIDHVLTDVILKDLEIKINSPFKEEVSQNLINLEFFANSINEIENYLNYSSEEIITSFKSSLFLIKLDSSNRFKQVRTEAENTMFALLDKKVNDLMEMGEWDWDTRIIQNEASIFIRDIGEFLGSMFSSTFNNLPYSFKSLLLIRTFDLLASHFRTALDYATIITNEAVHNFELNVEYIEHLIQTLNKQNSEQHNYEITKRSSMTLQSMFGNLRQIVTLLQEGDLDQYKDDTIRMRKFSTIKPDDARALVKKLESYQLRANSMNNDGLDHDGNYNNGLSENENSLSRDNSILNGLRRSPSTNTIGKRSMFGYKFRKDN